MRTPSQRSGIVGVKNGIAGNQPMETIRREIASHNRASIASPVNGKNDVAAIKRWLGEAPVEQGWNHIARTQQDLAASCVKAGRVKL